MTILIVVGGILVSNSASLQGRIALAKDNIESFKVGDYNTSLGHRLALWDIGSARNFRATAVWSWHGHGSTLF